VEKIVEGLVKAGGVEVDLTTFKEVDLNRIRDHGVILVGPPEPEKCGEYGSKPK